MGNNSIAGNGDDDSVEIGQLQKQIYVVSFLGGFCWSATKFGISFNLEKIFAKKRNLILKFRVYT